MGLRRILTVFSLAACQPSPANSTGFVSSPNLTTATTDPGSTSSTSSDTTGTDSDSGEHLDSTSEPFRDLGVTPDFGDDSPAGCKGKIDFLFVISRQGLMKYRQDQLVAAFPQFIDTIQSKFADFDYHIMVVASDNEWGNLMCNDLCPVVDCKVGDPCCSWYDAAWEGEQCCDLTYPCQYLDLVNQCDRTWGAGEVFPAGVDGEANKPCPVDGGRRYLVKGQTDLKGTFECIARVGNSGWGLMGQSLVAALQEPINGPGGCNNGFLRDDALLMVTFIANTPDDPGLQGSTGSPEGWAKAVRDAKHGDDEAVVMLSILNDEAHVDMYDRIGTMVMMFPYRVLVDLDDPDYAKGFTAAAALVDTACAGFTPPPG